MRQLSLSTSGSTDNLQINSEGVNNRQAFDLSRGNWDILFYSTLTLLFHASSAIGVELQISPRCFHAARNSLRAHLDFFPQYQKSQLLSDADYLNWSVLSLFARFQSVNPLTLSGFFCLPLSFRLLLLSFMLLLQRTWQMSYFLNK